MGTMKLIGATLLSIKMPVVLNSVFIGLLSGGFAILLFIAARSSINLISGEIPSNYFRLLFIAALLTGPALGILTSLISMRRISIKI
jgi:cell division protein FtsX